MGFELGPCLKSINFEKNNIFSEIGDGYTSFIINRSLSYFPDTIMYAYEISKYGYTIKPEINYMYWLESIPARKRFSRWEKKHTASELEKAIMMLYNVSQKKAEQDAECLSDEQKECLMTIYEEMKA